MSLIEKSLGQTYGNITELSLIGKKRILTEYFKMTALSLTHIQYIIEFRKTVFEKKYFNFKLFLYF